MENCQKVNWFSPVTDPAAAYINQDSKLLFCDYIIC